MRRTGRPGLLTGELRFRWQLSAGIWQAWRRRVDVEVKRLLNELLP